MARISREQVLPSLISVLTIAFVASIWPSFSDIRGAGVAVGDEAPDFTLTSSRGQEIHLKDLRGKWVVVNFWASWCPPCLEELPSLIGFHQSFASRNVMVLGVSVDEDEKAYRDLLDKAQVPFVNVRDPGRKVSHTYGTYLYPESYFIDPKGKIAQKVAGPANWSDPGMMNSMEQLLLQK